MNHQKTIYRLAVIGANGGVGRQVVELALKQGHFVTAILRDPAKLQLQHSRLELRQGDIMHPETITESLRGKDAVISAIGKNSLKPTTLYSEGNKNLLKAMEMGGVKRVFFISASGLEVNPTHSLWVRLLTTLVLQKLLKNMYADLHRMEDLVKASNMDWTIMRPPQLTDNAVTGNYRYAINHYLDNGLKISRADLAHFMLENINNSAIFGTTVEVAY
jgi:putative NADH-flavin reductase